MTSHLIFSCSSVKTLQLSYLTFHCWFKNSSETVQ